MARTSVGPEGPTSILPVVVSVVPATGLFVLDLIVLRPNRVTDGVGYTIGALGLPWWPSIVLCVALIALFLAFFSHRTFFRPALLLWAVAVTIVPWVLASFASSIFHADGRLGGLERINPGGGIWLVMISALAAWHELFKGARSRRRRAASTVALVASIGVVAALIAESPLNRLSYLVEYGVRVERFHQELARHVRLSGSAVLLATIIGVPAGMAAHRHRRFRSLILDVTSTIQTIPSLAMFGLLIAPLAALSRALPALRSVGISGVGATPALIALTLYALLPIVRNTLIGLSIVPRGVRESGEAMGMSRPQRFWMVEVPLALPIALRGVRTAAVQAIGNTTVAALIGAGGLGWFIFQGLGQAATDLVVLGVIPIVLLAVVVDRLFILLQRLTHRGEASGSAPGAA